MSSRFILGEFSRTLDERFRLSIPTELVEPLLAGQQGPGRAECILAKQQPGCLSLWPATNWQQRTDAAVTLVEGKLLAGKLHDRLDDVQTLGRLLSTRHRPMQLAGRGRLLIPRGFPLRVSGRRARLGCDGDRRRAVCRDLAARGVAGAFAKSDSRLRPAIGTIIRLKAGMRVEPFRAKLPVHVNLVT